MSTHHTNKCLQHQHLKCVSQNKIFRNSLFANCLQIKSKKLQRLSHHSFLTIILFCFVASWDSVWHSRGFVCGLSNLFFWRHAFSPSTRQLPGSSFAVHGQRWTTLIESGSAPNLAPRHISTEPRTLSQAQIPAAGRSWQRHTDADCNTRPQRRTWRRSLQQTSRGGGGLGVNM